MTEYENGFRSETIERVRRGSSQTTAFNLRRLANLEPQVGVL